MTKHEFDRLLREKIAQLPQKDIDSFSQYVDEMIDDRIEDGLSEEEAVADIGSIDDIVKAILSDAGKENKPQKTAPSKKLGFFGLFNQKRGEIIQKKYDISDLFDDIFVNVINADIMLMYGKEASNRKQEIDRQHYTIPNQRPKDKHCGKI